MQYCSVLHRTNCTASFSLLIHTASAYQLQQTPFAVPTRPPDQSSTIIITICDNTLWAKVWIVAVAGNHEGQKWLTESLNHLRRKHVEFGHAAHHDIIQVGALFRIFAHM